MSRLSKQSIRRLCEAPDAPMIAPFQAEKIRVNGRSGGLSHASYDCHIDHDLVLGVNPAFILANHVAKWGFGQEHQGKLRKALADNPPMQALAYTREDLHLPDNVAAAVCDKSTFARLFVSAFNTFFDPGFHGNATLELVNLGPEPVVYRRGDPVCQFLFEWLDEATEHPYDGKYQHQTKEAHAARFERPDGSWTGNFAELTKPARTTVMDQLAAAGEI